MWALMLGIGCGIILYLTGLWLFTRIARALRDVRERDQWQQATHVRLHAVLDDRDTDGRPRAS